jgi:hypothetical protein
MAAALDRLSRFDFDSPLSDFTREYLRQAAKIESGALAKDMAAAANGDRAAMQRVRDHLQS